MKKIYALIVGILVACALAAPFAVSVLSATNDQPAVVHIAADPTNTPRPPGMPCSGQGC